MQEDLDVVKSKQFYVVDDENESGLVWEMADTHLVNCFYGH